MAIFLPGGRTHTCGDLRSEHLKARATLIGWVRTIRDHGGVVFADLADRWGMTQVVFDPKKFSAEDVEKKVRREFVVRVAGAVRNRTQGTEDPRNPTGKVEVGVETYEVLAGSKTTPFEILEQKEGSLANEDTRLRHRYLDLRRRKLVDTLVLRHKVTRAVREYFWAHEFMEFETPTLVASTPEGARDFLVPSRLHPGRFYALPQKIGRAHV